MRTGRRRVRPAASPAWMLACPARIWSLAKVTSRMLFDVATPTLMIVPMRDGTLKVVRVTKSIQTMPLNAPGRALMMMKGSSQDWKFTTIRQYTRTMAKIRPMPRRKNAVFMLSTWPWTVILLPGGSCDRTAVTWRSTSDAALPRSRSCTLA